MADQLEREGFTVLTPPEAGRRLNLPVLYATVLEELCGEVERLLGVDSVPIWPMVRYMQRPWEGESMWSAPVRASGA